MEKFSITNPHPGYLRGLGIVYPVLKRCHQQGLLTITQEPMPGRISHEPAGNYMFEVAIGYVLRAELRYLDKRFVSEQVDKISLTVPCAGLYIFSQDTILKESVRPEWVVSFLLEEVRR